MNTIKISRGDIFQLNEFASLFYTRSQEELDSIHAEDRLAGNMIGDDGEPRIYSSQGSLLAPVGTTVMITALRGAEWSGWGRKPAGLIKAVVTSGRYLGREVGLRKRDLESAVRISRLV